MYALTVLKPIDCVWRHSQRSYHFPPSMSNCILLGKVGSSKSNLRITIKEPLIIIEKMQSRRPWTHQEDSTLKSIAQSCQSLELERNTLWHLISQRLKEALGVYKTPKQCQDRWNHHLKPGSVSQPEWTHAEQIQLFQLQEQLGNKWVAIASLMRTKSHTVIKNFFYATMRKGIRLINQFICRHRSEQFYRNFKTFPKNVIGKIIAQEQNKKAAKLKVTKDNMSEQAREIKSLLLEISTGLAKRNIIQQAILDILEFNRNCRRLRSKQKKTTQDSDQDQKEARNSNSQGSALSKPKENQGEQKGQVEQMLQIAKKQPNQSCPKEHPSTIGEMIFKEHRTQRYEAYHLNLNPRYSFECQENILLKKRKQHLSQLTGARANDCSAKGPEQRIGPQNIYQEMLKLPSLFTHHSGFNQELPKNFASAFDDNMDSQDQEQQFDEEYL